MEENNNFENKTVSKKRSNFNLWREVWEWLYTIVISLAIALIIKFYVCDIVRVDGPSMFPTLVNNDRLIVTKLGYTPSYGDIVILDSTYKIRQQYYKEYEDINDTTLNLFSKIRLYIKMPSVYRIKFYVKRIIGMPGDVIDLQDGNVILNGEVLDEPYYDGITGPTDLDTKFPFTVSEDCVFVMGDNRPNSKDSRSTSLGEVPIKALAGKSQFRIWPTSTFGVTK